MKRLLWGLLVLMNLELSTCGLVADDSMTSQVVSAIVLKTNDFRQSKDLSTVEENAALTQAALEFAQFMARSGKYGHYADDKTPAQRAQEAGYAYCVVRENIAYRLNTGEVTAAGLIDVFVNGWKESPSHRENMLADYVTQTGVAVATADQETYYAVQLFGRPKSAAIKLKVSNLTSERRTLVVEANDSSDEIELPSRSIVTMSRCFPTTLRLSDQEQTMQVTESAELVITKEGLEAR
jgi:hypothetical protein